MKFFSKKNKDEVKQIEDIENNIISDNDEYTYDYNSAPEDYNYNQSSEDSIYNYDYSQTNQNYDYYNYSNSDSSYTQQETTITEKTVIEENTEEQAVTPFENIISSELDTKLTSEIIYDENISFEENKENISVDLSKETPNVSKHFKNKKNFQDDLSHNNIKNTLNLKKKTPKKISGVLLTVIVISGLLINFGIFNIGENFQMSAALEVLPHTINDFSTEKIQLGSLDDGRNVYLYELPIKPKYSVPLSNSINILNIYKDEVLFFEENLTDSPYITSPVQTYNLKSGKFKTILSKPADYFNRENLMNDKYIVMDLQDSIYIYDRVSNIGEYIFKNNLEDIITVTFDSKPTLINESIYYLSNNTLYSYNIVTKDITPILASNDTTQNFSYKLKNSTEEYLLIERIHNETNICETLLIDTKNNNEIIILDYSLSDFSVIDKENSLILLNGDSDKGHLDVEFNKKTKELKILDDNLYDDVPYMPSNLITKDLIFEASKDYTNNSDTKNIMLNIYSMENKKATIFDLSKNIGTPQKYCDVTKYGSSILIEFEVVKDKYSRRYYISVENS